MFEGGAVAPPLDFTFWKDKGDGIDSCQGPKKSKASAAFLEGISEIIALQFVALQKESKTRHFEEACLCSNDCSRSKDNG